MAEKKELYKGAKGLRLGAFILWIFAIACEIFAIYLLTTNNNAVIYKLAGANFNDTNALLYWFIGILVVDAILCIIGALLWKRANRLKPSQSKNKVVKFFWDQLGVIVCIIAFVPFGILLILGTDKLNAKAKKTLLIIVALLFVGSTAASVDYNPVSPGDSQNVEALIKSHYSPDEYDVDENGNIIVYWTQYGKSMHLDETCYYIAESTTLTSGTVAEAIEAGKTDPCDHCMSEIKELNKDDIEAMAETTDESAADALVPELETEAPSAGDAE